MDQSSTTPMPSQTSKQIALITGGNRGIGLETAKRLATDAENYHVLMGCRDETSGNESLSTLHALGLLIEMVLIDVTDDSSIESAVETIKSRYGRLDVLVNNAGMSNDRQLGHAGISTRSLYQEQFNVNLFGAAQVTEAFIPLLQQSTTPHIVFLSSWLGSLAHRMHTTDRYYSAELPIYRTSKAALNMLCAHYATKFGDAGWKVNAVDPGHVATRLNNFKGPLPATEGAIQVVAMATIGPDGPNGAFIGRDGIVSW
ncbi:carbonyl reductase [Exophiala viscosa]|uniref:Carbonyl reductase n=1 Tax=Exophiala viscosa TaxID=2486360 RepID=A0AAN6E711_9EURO|nr:carbonyl reductase [Exophiala viscosa]KAI1627117.1 carbonyl reductase [Exophiala viscosa]